MDDKETTTEKITAKIVSGAGELGFWLFFALMVIFFSGEPDIQDAIIYWLMK